MYGSVKWVDIKLEISTSIARYGDYYNLNVKGIISIENVFKEHFIIS